MAEGTCAVPSCPKPVRAREWCMSCYMRWWYTGDPVDVRPTAVERFWSRIERVPLGCWLWHGSLTPEGYGQLNVRGRRVGAHRYSYELFFGPIPDGLHIDHLCRVPQCVKPTHLEPVTPGENIMRSPTAPTAINARKTHCLRGHPLDGVRSAGGRYCKTCNRLRMRAKKATLQTVARVESDLAR